MPPLTRRIAPVTPQHPLQRVGLLRRTLPFGVALALAFTAVAFVDVSQPDLVVVAATLAAALVIALVVVPFERLPRAVSTAPPLAVILVTLLLREGTGGLRDPVDFEILLLLPVGWFALYGTRRELNLAILTGAAAYAVSVLGTEDRGDEWVTALLWTLVAALIGLRVQTLVQQVNWLIGQPDVVATVLIVDDHPAVRAGLAALLAPEADLQVLAMEADGEAALASAQRLAPDLALIDFHLPGQDGLALCLRLEGLQRRPCVVLYTAFADALLVVLAAVAGARALVPKSADPEELLDALRAGAAGRAVLPQPTAAALDAAGAGLDPADLPVLGMLVHGIPPRRSPRRCA